MHPVDIKSTLDSMTILCDTREQDTPKLRQRLEAMGHPYERVALPSGDYSAAFTLPDGSTYSLAGRVCVERKMSLDEICGNYTRGRGRFQREFQRMADRGGKLHIIVENGSWEKVLGGEYRSQLSPASLSASLLAWEARYGSQLHFCKPETTGKLIVKILYYEMKEILERGELDEHSG